MKYLIIILGATILGSLSLAADAALFSKETEGNYSGKEENEKFQ
ncbi:hypothetical protein [Kaistella sp. 97-N-M2]|nr:hypothetical protein [Kaistella sp. 97-N-M2]